MNCVMEIQRFNVKPGGIRSDHYALNGYVLCAYSGEAYSGHVWTVYSIFILS